MSWLTPIGFLGLIGLVALIIIYIIKPNYQNKVVSSTFIWKLSLKLRKKQIPISKLRNIILFICQVLAICSLTFILAQPVIAAEKEDENTEKIAIIDASLSMFTEYDGTTRFERAVEDVRKLADETFESEIGSITIILANENPKMLVSGVTFENKNLVYEALDDLIKDEDRVKGKLQPITYASGDIDAAIKLAEEKTALDANTEVLLYTDTKYIDPGKVIVKDVKDPAEWNASILDVRTILEEHYYRLEIDVACFGGHDVDVDVSIIIKDFNGNEGKDEPLTATARCIGGKTTTLIFDHKMEIPDEEESSNDYLEEEEIIPLSMLKYSSIIVEIDEGDAFKYDDRFELHNGKKPTLRIQYASSKPNNFFSTALLVLSDSLSSRWDVEYVEVKKNEEYETKGFDFYIFEHSRIPDQLPDDGVVILANPSSIPSIAGVSIIQELNSSNNQHINLSGTAIDHPIMQNITAENIIVTKFKDLKIRYEEDYDVLMSIQDKPVVMATNEDDQKIVIMGFSLNYSNLSVLLDFPMLMYNIFEYYYPSTLTQHAYGVNDEVTLNSRSPKLEVYQGEDRNTLVAELEEFPGKLKLTTPGVYTVYQTPISGVEVEEKFFVKMPTAECDIAEEVDTLSNPYFATEEEKEDFDLLLYFALALVALLFVEWWLQSREQF